jgi:hypothetical protein
MSNILCEKPKYILNPAFKDALLKTGKYVYDGNATFVPEMQLAAWRWNFPYALFSPKAIDSQNFASYQDSYYAIDRDDDAVPMFLAIPCRKCALCRKRNAREWMFRAVAETQSSRSVPYFITLTYNPANRPVDGVDKKHVQDFLKRLRQILTRDYDYTETIRYFAAAEYGSHTKLPHYHLILWNMPINMSAMDVYKIVHQAWSVRKRVYNKLTHRFDWDYVGELGFVYCKPCTQGGIQYCMKYMRKESDVPAGCKPTFYLSSRRGGGLGYKWCLDHVLWFYQHPDVLTVEIVDKFTGERFTSYIPSYFRRKLYPTPSLLIRKEIRDTIQLVDYFLSIRACLWQIQLHMPDKEVNATRKWLGEKFPFYNFDTCVHRFPRFIFDNAKNFYAIHHEDSLIVMEHILEPLLAMLEAYEFDLDYYKKMTAAKREHHEFMSEYMSTLPEIDITYVKYKTDSENILAIYRETL